MKRNAHEAAGIAARVATLAAALCVAGCAWATALDDIPGDTDIYTAAQTDAAIAAATGAIHVAEADLTPSNAVLVATIKEVAPAPEDYETVSNKAINSVQSSGGAMTGVLTFTGGQNGANAKLHSDNGTLSIIGTDPGGSISIYSFNPSSMYAVARKSDIPAAPDLTAATNYTDAALAEFARTNKVLKAGPYLSATGGVVSTRGGITVRYSGPTLGAWPQDSWIYPHSIGMNGGFQGNGIEFVDRDVHVSRMSRRVTMRFPLDDSWEDGADVGDLALRSDIPDMDDYATQQQTTNAAIAVADEKISTNNAAFVAAVLAAPLAGASASDIAEIAEYGGYGTVGAALLALIAGLAALKRRVTSAETALAQKANATDLPYAMVTPDEWEFGDGGTHTISAPYEEYGEWVYELDGQGYISDDKFSTEADALAALSLTFSTTEGQITATRASLPGHLCDRANNLVTVTGNTTLTLPPFETGKVRDLLVACTIGLDTNDEPWSVIFQGADGEEISFKADGDDASTATFPVPDAAGDWWYSLTERAPHVFAVSLKQLQTVSQPQTQGGS